MYPALSTVYVLATECSTLAVTGSRTVTQTQQTMSSAIVPGLLSDFQEFRNLSILFLAPDF